MQKIYHKKVLKMSDSANIALTDATCVRQKHAKIKLYSGPSFNHSRMLLMDKNPQW